MGSAHVTFEANHEELQRMGQGVIDAATQIAQDNDTTITKATLESGPPAQHILSYAKSNDIDMIIMGSRGLSDLAGLMMGSVSHKVTHLAECSCITVR
jgi:nucleotide-binding universal stress UspA family protein